MSKIVLATFGSLGDLHPMIALGLELKKRGHDVTIAAMEFYREKIELTGLGFAPMAPHMDPEEDVAADLMDADNGTEMILRHLIMPSLPQMYEDITAAIDGADLLVTGEVVYAAKSVAEKTGVPWVSTTLAPISLFSSYDPPIPPPAPWFENLRFMPALFHKLVFSAAKLRTSAWLEDYKKFRRGLGLSEDHDPIFSGKYSELLHLIMFSRVIGEPQPDWPASAVQTGFCFYDGQADMGQMPEGLEDFLDAGEPPIVFTLGSAAVMDPRNFFTESIAAAKKLRRRAIMLYGIYNEPPTGLNEDIVGFGYAPFSTLFPRAACVVHQAGVGTTGQVLRAGVPHLIMPYGHDQPDNAARCRRAGVAEIITRENYNADIAAETLGKILGDARYADKAREIAEVVRSEHGTTAACDEIEKALKTGSQPLK
ncbi:MAG: glycosyltransferase [Pyrinomonadaceae bacterium]|nr:glycosyltransferase [Pyrinomonadaceae bacterium]